jgi:hypothetical protein
MTIKEMLTELGNRYGQSNVVVHTEYHIQILRPGKPHDIWAGTKTGLKWRLAGQHDTQSGSPEKLLAKLADYDEKNTDFSKMQEAVYLSNLVGNVGVIAAREKITRAVFCDAGFKDGKSRIGLVRIDGEDVTAIRRGVTWDDIRTINDAECLAIEMGIELANELGPDVPVFSDSQTAVNLAANPRVKWVPREKNKHADKIANLRKQ